MSLVKVEVTCGGRSKTAGGEIYLLLVASPPHQTLTTLDLTH